MARRVRFAPAAGAQKNGDAVFVGRPTKWGNPHLRRTASESPQALVDRYRADLFAGRLPFTVADVRRELAGRDLWDWTTPPYPSHVDVLIELVNAPEGQEGEDA